jgi:nitroreductase
VSSAAFVKSNLPTAKQLDELFKQRRSIRKYTSDKIDRDLLAEIVNYGIYAPTHNYSLRVIIVDDESVIKSLDSILIRFVTLAHRVMYKPWVIGWLAKIFGMEEEYLLNKPKVEGVIKNGKAFNHPAAIVFIVGDKKIPLSIDSAQYSLANITFYAQIKGIASCLWGNGPIFMDKSPKARKLLGLQRHDRIFGALFLGYPVTNFRNKVEGREMPIQWVVSDVTTIPEATMVAEPAA